MSCLEHHNQRPAEGGIALEFGRRLCYPSLPQLRVATCEVKRELFLDSRAALPIAESASGLDSFRLNE